MLFFSWRKICLESGEMKSRIIVGPKKETWLTSEPLERFLKFKSLNRSELHALLKKCGGNPPTHWLPQSSVPVKDNFYLGDLFPENIPPPLGRKNLGKICPEEEYPGQKVPL